MMNFYNEDYINVQEVLDFYKNEIDLLVESDSPQSQHIKYTSYIDHSNSAFLFKAQMIKINIINGILNPDKFRIGIGRNGFTVSSDINMRTIETSTFIDTFSEEIFFSLCTVENYGITYDSMYKIIAIQKKLRELDEPYEGHY